MNSSKFLLGCVLLGASFSVMSAGHEAWVVIVGAFVLLTGLVLVSLSIGA